MTVMWKKIICYVVIIKCSDAVDFAVEKVSSLQKYFCNNSKNVRYS